MKSCISHSTAQCIYAFAAHSNNSTIDIGHVGKVSVSGYSDQRYKPRLHQYVVSLSKTLNPYCFSRLSCEMRAEQEHLCEECLFSAIIFPEDIALKIQYIFWCVCVCASPTHTKKLTLCVCASPTHTHNINSNGITINMTKGINRSQQTLTSA